MTNLKILTELMKKFLEEKPYYLLIEDKYPILHNLLINKLNTIRSTEYIFNLRKIIGDEYSNGYNDMDRNYKLSYPKDHHSHNNNQIEWYYIVGNFIHKNNKYGIQFVIMIYDLFPEHFLNKNNINKKYGRVFQILIAITINDKTFTIDTPIYTYFENNCSTSTNGDIFEIKIDDTIFRSDNIDDIFPLNIKSKIKSNINFEINAKFDKLKPLFENGHNGQCPCIDGLGSYYYSYSKIIAKSLYLKIDNEIINLENTGSFWFDHQWNMKGLMYQGIPKSLVFRASNNLIKSTTYGWDWLMIQLDDNTEYTISSPINKKKYINNIDDKIEQIIYFKKIDKNGYSSELTKSKMILTDWFKFQEIYWPKKWIIYISNERIIYASNNNESIINDHRLNYDYKETPIIITTSDNINGTGYAESIGYQTNNKHKREVLSKYFDIDEIYFKPTKTSKLLILLSGIFLFFNFGYFIIKIIFELYNWS